MMSLRIISYIICFFCTFATSMAKSDLSRLESVLAHRDDYISTKEHRIDSIKSDLKNGLIGKILLMLMKHSIMNTLFFVLIQQ